MLSASASVPAPTGGWNARDAVAQMGELDAIRLINVFPSVGTVDLRKGYRPHATSLGSGAVQGMAEFAGPTGTRKLIAFANNKVYDGTTYNAAATDITNGATITVNKWQTANFRSTLVMVNGTDQPLQYDGSSVTSATYTGVTDENLISVFVYKSRLYFIEKNTAKIWYGGVNEITGALTSNDVAGLLNRGGFLQAIGSFSRDVGDATDDLFVMVSNMGEVLMYSGDYPGAINWVQVARYFLPVPIGRRCLVGFGSDLLVITESGVIPLGQVMQNAERPDITDKIQNAFRLAGALYKGNFGWQAIQYPRSHYMLVNIPISESTSSEQYVMNTETGAWCRFTGVKACCWCLLNEKLYFGGVNGKVYEADVTQADDGAPIQVDMKGAFNYLGSDKRNKRVTMARPHVTANTAVTFNFNVDVDFADRDIATTATTATGLGSPWDTSPWDTSEWANENVVNVDWYSVNGIGRAVSPRLSGSFNGASFSLSAIDYIYEQGGLL